MKTFLQEIASEIINKYDDFRQIDIIVPNRRTALFLKKYIADSVNKTIWVPSIVPIQEIFSNNSNLQKADDLLLIHHLYNVFKKHIKTDESFEDFYSWGEVLLNDFDDIDKYLIEHEKIFSTIKNISEIDKIFQGYSGDELNIIKKFWINIDPQNSNEIKDKFIELWGKMLNIYTDFREILLNNNIAYQGLIYRTVAETVSNCNFIKTDYIIVGFSALNECEKTVFDWLKSNKNTIFFWDIDKYYINDTFQEAGRFLRENVKKYPNYNNIGIVEYINKQPKQIEIIAAPSPVSQVKVISQILKEWQKNENFNPEKTAIVFGNENLLLPLMYSIPPEIEAYNITMGFPVVNSAAFSFISTLLSLQRNAKISSFHFKDVLSIINHSFLKSIFKNDSENIENKILHEKLVYVDSKDLLNNDLYKDIFNKKITKITDISKYLITICNKIATLLCIASLQNDDDFKVEIEFFNKIINHISVIDNCLQNEKIEIDKIELYIKLLNKSLKNIRLAFEGEPTIGMQVLGFMETRCLDFDKVIMLSINEDVFPKNSTAQSLIPYNVRKFHKLPSIEFQDSIFAYYFYRIIQRATDIKILYSANSEETTAEASRFITQIKYEFDHTINNINFRNDGYKININNRQKTFAKKTENAIKIIKNYFAEGISPTAINTYIDCKFKYYLRYIENIKEIQKIEETEDSAFFGNLFHHIAKKLYEPYIGKIINETEHNLISSEENLKNIVKKSIIEFFNLKSDDKIKEYEEKLMVEIVITYIKQLLNYDKNHLPLTIISLEEEHYFNLSLNDTDVKISGKIDRIDILDGIYRVMDYKTGKTNLKIPNIDALFEENRKINNKYDYIIQIFLYSLMLASKQKDSNIKICPGILNINELNTEYDYKIILSKNIIEYLDNGIKEEFINKLKVIFCEMLNQDIDFVQSEEKENCDYCPYKIICGR